jgi:hypothetical protein
MPVTVVLIDQGLRVIGFDNKRGKGDQWHCQGKAFPYQFLAVDRLIDDIFPR